MRKPLNRMRRGKDPTKPWFWRCRWVRPRETSPGPTERGGGDWNRETQTTGAGNPWGRHLKCRCQTQPGWGPDICIFNSGGGGGPYQQSVLEAWITEVSQSSFVIPDPSFLQAVGEETGKPALSRTIPRWSGVWEGVGSGGGQAWIFAGAGSSGKDSCLRQMWLQMKPGMPQPAPH